MENDKIVGEKIEEQKNEKKYKNQKHERKKSTHGKLKVDAERQIAKIDNFDVPNYNNK